VTAIPSSFGVAIMHSPIVSPVEASERDDEVAIEL
jgi:hypothetical protein